MELNTIFMIGITLSVIFLTLRVSRIEKYLSELQKWIDYQTTNDK